MFFPFFKSSLFVTDSIMLNRQQDSFMFFRKIIEKKSIRHKWRLKCPKYVYVNP